MESLDEYKKKIAEYEKRMGIGEDDPAKEGYLVLVDILRQQNKYLKGIKIEDIIEKEDKSKAVSVYERAKALWEKLPSMIQSVSSLRTELKIDGDKSPSIAEKPITPQSIALNGGRTHV